MGGCDPWQGGCAEKPEGKPTKKKSEHSWPASREDPKTALTDPRRYATIAFKMKGSWSFFYAYFYGAPKAAVASR
jgi:hypothetical protein